jgi:hypothetical protein
VIRGKGISEVGDRFRGRWTRIERPKLLVNARAHDPSTGGKMALVCQFPKEKVGVGLP